MLCVSTLKLNSTVSTGTYVHHKIIAPTSNEKLDVLDHHFHRGSLTPGVELDVSIPGNRHDLWHSGGFLFFFTTVFSNCCWFDNTKHD